MYFLGEREPTEEERAIIEAWKKLPVVTLLFDGPTRLKDQLISSLNDVGVLVGEGDPLLAFADVDESGEYVAIWLSFKGREIDDFEDPVPVEDLEDFLVKSLEELLGRHEKPETGFVVYTESGRFNVRLGKTEYPVEFRKSKGKWRLKVDGEERELKEGFYDLDGKRIYLGRDMEVEKPDLSIRFYENVRMVYPDGSRVVGSKLVRPDGSEVPIENLPVNVFSGGELVFRNEIRTERGRLDLKNTVVMATNGFALLSNGEIVDVKGRWKMKVSCPPLEWDFRDGYLYVLDICGYLKVVDVEKKKILKAERRVGMYGFDFLGDDVVLGVNGEVIVGDSELRAKDFCVVKGKIVTFESSNVLRTHRGYCLVFEGERVKVLGADFETLYKGIMIFDEFVAIAGDEGVWVVKFPKRE